ncbi:MAG: hypothetical protein MUF54_15525 [Polyangiaceae bacterium]|jgi:hypothetical protein|nr:hypothetical protein [Polyangiaceae bacterium]
MKTGPFATEQELRDAAVMIAWYVCNGDEGRVLGDPVFDEVTEGRARWRKYSSCGDLVHFLLLHLGLRDERILNRNDDGGTSPWAIGQNLSRIVFRAGKAFVWASTKQRPKPGDVLYVAMPEHVCILESIDEQAGTIATFDYGQFDPKTGKPAGRRRVSKFRVVGPQMYVGNRVLRGWLDIAKLPGLVAPS